MAGNANFDSILSTTLKNYTPKLEDNIFTSRALFYWLTSNGRITTKTGGAKLVEPLMYSLNDTAGSYAGYDNISTNPQDPFTAAEYDWKQFAVSIAISGIEEAKNNGTAAIVDLLQGKITQAEMTVSEKLDKMFFSDGTGNSSKDFLGLKALVGTGDLGGITESTNTWWSSTVDSTSEALTIAKLSHSYNTASVGNDHPNGAFTTQALLEKYESLLQPQLRFSDPKTADAGFENLLYKNVPVAYDTYCDAGYWYFLNSKYLALRKHSNKWMTTTPFVKPWGQDARYAQILSYGEFVTSNRARQGLLTGKS